MNFDRDVCNSGIQKWNNAIVTIKGYFTQCLFTNNYKASWISAEKIALSVLVNLYTILLVYNLVSEVKIVQLFEQLASWFTINCLLN